MKARLLTRIALILSFGGIFVSAVLAIAHIAGKDVPCGASGGCHTVAQDPSSHILFGLDNAYLGLAAYLALAVFAAMRLLSPTPLRTNLLLAYLGSVAGAIFSGYLTYLEIFQIHAICLWCVASAVIITLLLFFHAAEYQGLGEVTPEEGKPGGRLDFALILGCVLVTLLSTGAVSMGMNSSIHLVVAPPEKFQQFPLVPADANIFGRPDAPVTIVEFADLQCPVCRSEFPKMKDLVSRYNGRVRLIFRHFPLDGPEHNMALPAAAVAEYAGTKGRFFEFVEAVYATDPEKLKTPEGLFDVAKSVGLDPDAAKQQILDDKSAAFSRVWRDKGAANEYGIMYTPTFFVFTPGNETHPDVGLAANVEEMLKTPKYRKVIDGGG